MKRSMALCLALAAVISLSACGANEKTTENSAESSQAETTAKAETEATTTAPETTEAETTTEEPPKELPKITSYRYFVNGCMTFEAEGKNYALNLADKKIYEYDNKEHTANAVAHKIALTGDNKIYNFETGEEYEGEYLINSFYLSEFNPVYKVDESFDGNVTYFGVIDWNGEWVLPLSSEYEICKNELERSNYSCSDSFISNSYSSGKVYDFKNNKTYNAEDYGFYYSTGFSTDNILFGIGPNGYNKVSKYNTQTGELTTIIENNESEYPFDYRAWYAHGTAFVKTDGSAIILDNDFNVLDYDLSEYNITKVFDATEDYIIFRAKTSGGDSYAVILKRDGSRVIEPIKCDSGAVFGAFISGDYVILNDLQSKDYVIDCKSGETKIYDDDKAYEIEKFDTESGLMLVKADGAYFLADPSAPDTLINPFELAQ